MKKITLSLLSLLLISVQVNAQTYGHPVTGFGTNGFLPVTTKYGLDSAKAMLQQPDGKIVIAGVSWLYGYKSPVIARILADGTLDNSFGVNGVFSMNANANTNINSVALQSDGKIIAVGGKGNGNFRGCLLMRLTANGTPDATFGSNGTGYVFQDFSNSTSDVANAVGIQTDGKIAIAGTVSGLMFVARFTAAGVLDNTFGSNGFTTPHPSSTSAGNCLKILTDNTILVGGNIRLFAGGSFSTDVSLVKLTSNGALASAFGSSGKFTVNISADEETVNALTVLPDGHIILAGSKKSSIDKDMLLVSVKSTGVIETNFSGSGYRSYNLANIADDYAQSVFSLADNSIIVAGENDGKAFLAKYDNSGFEDNGFGTSGVANYDFSEIEDVAYSAILLNDGNYAFCGIGNNDIIAATVNAAGAYVTTFAGTGRAAYQLGESNYDYPYRLIKSNVSPGKYYAAGFVGDAAMGYGGIMRINENGTKDAGFGNNSIALVNNSVDNLNNAVIDIAEQADGKLIALVGGDRLMRITASGVKDISFGNAGEVVLPVITDPYFNISTSLQLDANGNILVAGWSLYNGIGTGTGHLFVLKLNSAGTIDMTFGNDGFAYINYDDVGGQGGITKKIIIQPDGKILLCGNIHDGSRFRFFAARLTASGTPDAGFGTAGKVMPDYNGVENYCNTITLQPDGKILLGGGHADNLPVFEYLICRLNADGSIDNTFGTAGFTSSSTEAASYKYYATGYEGLQAMTVMPNGNIIVGGPGSTMQGSNLQDGFPLLSAIKPDGTWDASFAFDQLSGKNGKIIKEVLIANDGNILMLSLGSFIFGKFSSTHTTLPVTLTKFTGKKRDNHHLLEWEFATADNVNRFEIEQSTDGTRFQKAGEVPFTTGHQYQFANTNIVTGRNYYRLKTVDNDGTFEYSNVILLTEEMQGYVRLYPVPAYNSLTVEVSDARGWIYIFDASGKNILQQKINSTINVIETRKLSAGAYYLKIDNGEKTTTQKFIKQ